MRVTKFMTTLLIGACLLCASNLISPLQLHAQQYGMGGGMGMGGMGMGGMYGMGGGGMGMGYPGADGMGDQNTITCKYGEKVYDAVFGDLIDCRVWYVPIPVQNAADHYYDDGTNGDEVAYDGVPSLIHQNRDTYLGPFSIRYKKQLEKMIEKAEEMGPLEFYRLNVVTKNEDSNVRSLVAWKNQMESEVMDFLQNQLAQFEGYDEKKYVKSVDPTLFESMEGAGAGFGDGLGPGGYIPDLPPPPGLPTQEDMEEQMEEGMEFEPGEPGMQQQQPGGGINRPIDQANQAVDNVNTMSGMP